MIPTYQQKFFDTMLDNNDSEIKNIVIYHNNYVGRMIQVLKLLYPATVKLVGENFFEELAAHFSVRNMPRKSYLSAYGFRFIKYMCSNKHTKHMKYLQEFMCLEFMLDYIHNVYKLNIVGDYSNVEPNSILRLNTDVYPLLFNYNINEIRKLCLNEIESAYLTDEKHYYLIFRDELNPKILEIEENIYQISRLLHKNKKLTLQSIFSLLNMKDDEFANSLAFLLANNLLVFVL